MVLWMGEGRGFVSGSRSIVQSSTDICLLAGLASSDFAPASPGFRNISSR